MSFTAAAGHLKCHGMRYSAGKYGRQTKVIKGLKTNINLLPKILVDVVTDDDKVEAGR